MDYEAEANILWYIDTSSKFIYLLKWEFVMDLLRFGPYYVSSCTCIVASHDADIINLLR